jgi:23S rRNA (guanosine2251-2'-O)-methyltransferase
MEKLNAKQLRSLQSIGNRPQSKHDIYIVLDNVLDTYNIGSIFRLAEASGVKKIYLCGGSETPPNHRIKKASINTTEIVEWQYYENALEVIKDLRFKIKDIQVVAVEQSKKSMIYDQFEYKLPICLVVGHETEGVSREVLEMTDAVVEIPMYGVNISLNVVVSTSIVLYEALKNIRRIV